MADQKMISYIKSSMDGGLPISRIKIDLYKAGWPKRDVEEAFAFLDSSQVSAAKKEIKANPAISGKPSRKRMYALVSIILLIAGIGTYYAITNYLLSIPEQPILPPHNATCGDGKCQGEETYEICPADCASPPANQNLSVAIPNPARAAIQGDNLTFDVQITSVSNLYGFQFDLEYDPAILQFTKATEGPFLSKSKADSTFCIDPKVSQRASKSYVTIACTRLGPVGGVSGNGTLESVAFAAIISGTARLEASNIKLVDSSAKRIDYNP